MSSRAEAIVSRVQSDPTVKLTQEDADVLLAEPKRTLMMEKLLGMFYFQSQQFDQAILHAKVAFEQEKTAENAKNISLLLRKCRRVEEALEFTGAHETLFDPIVFNDVMCMMHGDLKNIPEAVKYGTRSLEMKDAGADPAPKLEPVVRPFDPTQPARNLIVFSLWGADGRYLTGAQNNAVVARYLYPGWQARFYVDRSVPEQLIKALQYHGAQVVMAPDKLPAAKFGLFWRFMVEDDPNVDLYIVRDADSVMNMKERAAVEDWLKSGKAFHVMRDLATHSELILAGMWGAHRGNLGNLGKRVTDHLDAEQKRMNNVTTDQVFLRNVIWPVVKQDALVHDDYFEFGNPTRFRDEFRLPGTMHIGQNDWVNLRRKAKGAS
ncbi:MAG: UDP-N-acetylglucosamine-peptide N-acetylglucosaminyltransferase [Pseudomonadota bacterium]